MKKIGFFGGCFNPPTNMHIKIAKDLIEQGKLDKVVFVPVNNYYKKENLAEAKHRYNMLCLATKNYPNLEVDDILIKEDRKLFAVNAFEVISNSNFEKKNIFLVMGSDNYNKMPTWKDYNKIKNKYNYIVIERDKDEISSTQIRDMIKNNDKHVMEYLSEDVYKYILENNLYKL
jgi:nicotinate-nucleotide adenylyltransferase